ncbi:tRNA uridine-5-carboxymethylaminomethyl(34) synthesis enzyme MnmG [uncultured Selenomonas sp.]|uniref:tRNA uridine-5-carboxymethylaminomethyl(34) synthesis enzyme MnmG n=1 Tax=uncultured Selenomonas sp. TaxID=159275 RepID=UPI0028E85E9E|nr:tRNA uridine-5-carboxymethylaminomethyl(34) synthesis enzyme MnmG [uncultured Selenomonas sp.]
MSTEQDYDIIVIGAGHAGVEAALASARMGQRTLIVTLSLDNIAMMPCNPSVGGPGKSHLVREIDALGGAMGIAADRASIQRRLLNTGKGPAVHALRMQADKFLYQRIMKETLENTVHLDVRQLLVTELRTEETAEGRRVTGIRCETGEQLTARAVILATGTYLRGRIILGETIYDGGPNGQRPAMAFSDSLRAAGIRLMRFKTGTPARVDRRTLDLAETALQAGDPDAPAFSFLTDAMPDAQTPCYLTYTNEATHAVIRANLHRAPMANGVIEGIGPRYCPSIETKIARFPDKERHQLFLEPEGLHTNEIYVQGMSTSLPTDVQEEFLRTIPGLQHARMMRPGYAIEYDCLDPLQLEASLAVKGIAGLYSAGQANGTSGYEEAAAQGLIAGINAARACMGEEPLILRRSDGYIGVLIDDLVTKGTEEPYRMMTSRAEYRLVLRQDNADLRLTPIGRRIGLVSDARWARFTAKRDAIEMALAQLRETRLSPSAATEERLAAADIPPLRTPMTLFALLAREGDYRALAAVFDLPPLADDVREEVEIMARYDGYIRKQEEQIARMERLEARRIPADTDYAAIGSLRLEAAEKLAAVRPRSIGQASRISGVSPADISVLLVWLEKERRQS